MSEEYIFENPYELLDRGFDKNDFAQIIRLLQEDRKQWINQYTKAHNDYVELQKENQQLRQVLDEIREYINDNVAVYAFNNPDLPHWEFNDDDIEQILQILDKVKE